MKTRLVRSLKKAAAVAVSAMFLGATASAASFAASGPLSSLPSTFVHSGAVNAVAVVGAVAQPVDIAGAIDVAAALTANAASTHTSSSGVVTIGTLSLSSKSKTTNYFGVNASAFTNGFSPASVNLYAANYTVTGAGGAKNNYTSVENLTFLSKPIFNGLNVQLPAAAYELVSYIVNRSASGAKYLGPAAAVLNYTTKAGFYYYLGNTSESLLTINSSKVKLGTQKSYTYVAVPSTLSVGTNTINLEGVTNTLGSGGSYYQLEVSVNNGATDYVNFSATNVAVGPVFLTTGVARSTGSGTYNLSSLAVSSTSVTQNNSKKALLTGLSDFNVSYTVTSAITHGFINLTNPPLAKIPYSFSAVNNYYLPGNLTSIALEQLTHNYHEGNNITVTVGAASSDTLNVAAYGVANKTALGTLSGTTALPNVGVGAGELFTSSVSVPSNLTFAKGASINALTGAVTATANNTNSVRLSNILVNNSLLYTVDHGAKAAQSAYQSPGAIGSDNGVSLGFTALSSSPAGVLNLFLTNATGELGSSFAFEPLLNSSAGTTFSVLKLPTGRILGLEYTLANVTPATKNGSSGWFLAQNLTKIYNFTASTLGSPVIISRNAAVNKTYQFNGFNLTVNNFLATHLEAHGIFANVTLKGPVANVAGTTGDSFSFVPGQNGLYASNGTVLSAPEVSSVAGADLGSLSFSNGTLKFTDPTGGTQSVKIGEYSGNFSTYLSGAANTSANTWGDYFSTSASATKFYVPTQNYTLAVQGSEVVSGQVNYTVGEIVSGGKVLNVGGSSAVSASGLFGTNVFPLAMLDSSFVGATDNVPVIIVGGPAVNKLAWEALGQSGPVFGSKFTNLTGVGANEALVQYFSKVGAFNNQSALLIAGYSGNDTLAASEVVAESLLGTPVVTLNGTKMVLSTSSGPSDYKGVTIVSSS